MQKVASDILKCDLGLFADIDGDSFYRARVAIALTIQSCQMMQGPRIPGSMLNKLRLSGVFMGCEE